MQTKRQDLFTTVRTEGSVLPPDLLQRIVDEDADLAGISPSEYHLSGERINEAVGRSWNRLQGAWTAFRQAIEKLPPEDAGTSAVRERWLLPLFQELGYGRLQVAKAIEIEGKSYPISHAWQHAPIHLVSSRADLDKRSPGVTGASKASPHSLVQELLNREDAYLWGFVSNGLRLRILRDNKSLTRQAFAEFDLQAMMDGQVYPDFKLLWLLCHQSRVEGERPDQCWLEKWSQTAIKQGTRALDSLRDGVQRAIEALGRGFLSYPANRILRDRLQAGSLDKQDYYRQLLRLVYRLLFLFVAEDRGLLFDPKSTTTSRERYTRFYSTQRLRTLAGSSRGTAHVDLYQVLHLVFTKLDQTGCTQLGVPALGSFLWSANAISDLKDARITNRDLLDAFRELAFTTDGQARRPVDYKNLGAEELGSIYESLLELHPQINADAGTFALATAAGHERKTTGSYYTPTSLVNCLLDSALEPVLDEAVKGGEGYKDRGATAADRVLSLKVCDPACGSGHFLIAAAHRIAKRLAAVRTGEDEPAPDVYRHALRDVIGHCIYGVDLNSMAVELCKVSLWMEALEPGRPLSFLDHRVQVGNSLIGATPVLLARGIPDEAFEPSEGDDKAVCKAFKKQNKDERKGQHLSQEYHRRPWEHLGNLASSLAQLDAVSDETIDGVQLKQRSYEDLVRSSTYETGRLLADTWCAAFVWKKTRELDYPITEGVLRRIERNPHDVPPWMREEIRRLARQYQFFHWHLSFPDVFTCAGDDATGDNVTGWSGGFDLLLGNPPWVRQEFLKPVKPLLSPLRSFTSTADSSVYFLERSVDISRMDGRVALLTPNKWLRSNYAERLRSLLRERCRVELLVDFGHSRSLFPGVDTFPAAVVLTRLRSPVAPNETVRFVQAHDDIREQHGLAELLRSHVLHVPHRNLRPERWQFESTHASDLLDRLLATGQPLQSFLGRPILRGLLSGLNEAFYVDSKTRDAIVSIDPGSSDLFKKFLRGRDVRRWVPKWDDQWHIVIPSSQNRAWPWSLCKDEEEAEQRFAETYPGVHSHLNRYSDLLRARQDKGAYWWELRACDYYDDLEEPKIVVQCIAYYSQFAFDGGGHYVNNKVIVIPTDDHYVLAILNSRPMWWIVNRTFQHMKDEGLSVDVQYLRQLPIPSVSADLRDEVERLSKRLVQLTRSTAPSEELREDELRLNALVEEAFGLTSEERNVLQASLPPRDPVATLGDWRASRSYQPRRGREAEAGPAAPALITTARDTNPELIVRAFLDTREGMSSDYVVASPDANARFLARARKLGVGGSDFDINHWLLNARKAGKLKGEPTEVEYRLPDAYEPWVFASEWAGRHLQRQLVSETDRMVTLDDILCNPSLAARFDELAVRVKPGFAPLEYRWAAFSQRKRGKAKPAAKTLKVSLNRQMTLDEAMGQAPHGPGLYLIRSGPKPLYLNHAANLNDQIARHREAAAGQLVPEWLTQGVGPADELTFEHLLGINRDRLREARISSVADLRPWLNLLDLEGAA